MENYFDFKKFNTSIKQEVLAGITTFLTMVYIIFVNPAILSAAGIPFEQVFMATIIAAVIGTVTMGLFAKYPIAVAPGMGLNAYFTSVVATQGLTYQAVLGTVFLAGLVIIILSLTNLRKALIEAIPAPLKYGITAGIGLFIAFLGLKMAGIVVPSDATMITLGDLTSPVTALAIGGLFVTLILMAKRVSGALFYGMVLTAIAGYFFNMLSFNGIVDMPPAPQFIHIGDALSGVVTNGLYTVVFAFILVTIFDSTGTLVGVSEQAGFMKDGKLARTKPATLSDAIATTAGAALGTSPSCAYIESSAGVAAGGRTGLTSIVVAGLFLLSMFFSPAISAISSLPAITAPILIIVGCFMMEGLAKIQWRNFDEAFPAFAIILTMPLTSSIATGIAVGFITYPIMKAVNGKWKDVHPLIYVFAVIFLIQMIYFPAH
ncbi:NCS2 family permease [Sutcliffiella horikoshii]|uniref:Guanine permease n=1 Tax=Sutcliffiella horikoshii TaxID=79883 RepID=A0A1Y0CL69_9BACI|nr:NCS2 family permease [Sutcliffiella horikoshii]ART76018.1 guanine permease [Sutcliffiella horikoshii]TYS61285.1 NCS2 family permease [Sutcliffiella horikoshii]